MKAASQLIYIAYTTNDIMTSSFDAQDIHKMTLDVVVAEVNVMIAQMNLI